MKEVKAFGRQPGKDQGRLLAEVDSCGIGFVADRQGRAQHRILQMGLEALVRLRHRGAVNADGRTGDGTGVQVQIPYEFFAEVLQRRKMPSPPREQLGVGVLFLPRDARRREQLRAVVDHVFEESGFAILLWREVPVRLELLGREARRTCPKIYQILISRPLEMDGDAFEHGLYLVRRRIERQAVQAAEAWSPTLAGNPTGDELYVVSLSHRTMVYKSMALAEHLAEFYPDLGHAKFKTAIVLFHQRFSTNTLPTWRLAQPFRMLAHNGEINTIQGNEYWMAARENELRSQLWGDGLQDLLPVIERGSAGHGASDSGMLDNTLEFLVRCGRDPLHAMMMLIPEANRGAVHGDSDIEAFYDYHSTLMEPWDGPAAVVFSDGRLAAACVDRNGLRPQRYWLTDDDLVIVGSEAGFVEIDEERIIRKGRLGPGEMLAVDTAGGVLWLNGEIKREYARRKPYRQWVRDNVIEPPSIAVATAPLTDATTVHRRQKIFGYTREAVERILEPMIFEARTPIGSMGDDTPLPVMSDQPNLLYSYFKQRFAQVTNPPIDSLRERSVFSLESMVGPWNSAIDEGLSPARMLRFDSPILRLERFEWIRDFCQTQEDRRFQWRAFSTVFDANGDDLAMRRAVEALCTTVETAVDEGCTLVVLSDRDADRQRAPIPMLLATAVVHHHLIRARKRMQVSLICDTAEPREDHHFACLIGYGATLIHPYLVFHTIARRVEGIDLEFHDAVDHYLRALERGLLKIMAKLGVCPVSSYQGAQLFEALGLDRDLVDQCFTGTPSRIGGVGWKTLAREALVRHATAFDDESRLLDRGWFRFRKGGEVHALRPQVFKALHQAVRTDSPEAFARYAELSDGGAPSQVRDLLTWRPSAAPLEMDAIEPIEAIVPRFVTAAMSHGALSREAHEALAVAMNRIGGRSNSGEGGEAPERFMPYGEQGRPTFESPWQPQNGDWGNSAIKQIASGRFGVTPAYLLSARELEIKMAQGSKPGEGGQIPGHKVSVEIAALRRSAPGIRLISPPPHHDIYSIEDLAQLIHDLKSLNPEAKIGVKLVSVAGVGTIAAGVAKAGADYIQISGDMGGTGASPLSSIKHAGMPWELGLAETQRVLVENDLRGHVRLRVDGGFKTGRDVMIAALLGAEEFAFGTVPLIALGCIMARQCHLNTCPVGIATQREDLRARFPGTPDQVVAFMNFVAQQVRLILSEMGYGTLDEVLGRVDLLDAREWPNLPPLDLSALLVDTSVAGLRARRSERARNGLGRRELGLEERLLDDLGTAIDTAQPARLRYRIRNSDRSIGARLAGELVGKRVALPEATFEIEFTGAAGQSFGVFLPHGVVFRLSGEAQDYVGKSLAGGDLILRPPEKAPRLSHENVIAGNAVLYGATGGRLFAAGQVGERFCVRNSGAVAVVEGCGDYGCEYMTAGVAVILGRIGFHFAAGMSGGVAYVYDEDDVLEQRLNPGEIRIESLSTEAELEVHALIEQHAMRTGSARPRSLLTEWEAVRGRILCVVPLAESATVLASSQAVQEESPEAGPASLP